MTSRPAFVDELLKRDPLPPVSLAKLTDKSNPPFRKEFSDKIASLMCHPALESALHLMNDDLFSAHFLLRKMQEDEWAKWLHGILHLIEGDLEKNAKLWYEQVDSKVLSTYWGDSDPVKAAHENMYRVKRIKEGTEKDQAEDVKARKIKWEELTSIMKSLEKEHGWESVDGTQFYTKDEDPSHQSLVMKQNRRDM